MPHYRRVDQHFDGVSNVKLLNEKYDKIEICFNFESYQALTDSIERIIEKIIPLWTEDSIPEIVIR